MINFQTTKEIFFIRCKINFRSAKSSRRRGTTTSKITSLINPLKATQKLSNIAKGEPFPITKLQSIMPTGPSLKSNSKTTVWPLKMPKKVSS